MIVGFCELTKEEVLEVEGGLWPWVIPALKAVGTGVLAGVGTRAGEEIYEEVKSLF